MAILTSLRFYNSIKNFTLNPTFNSDTHQYTLTQDTESLTLQCVSDGVMPILKVNERTPYGVVSWNADTSTLTYQFSLQELIEDTNIVDILVESSPGVFGSAYRIRIKRLSETDKWPIHEHLLRPGFFGGSYVPNYRMLKEIYTCGSGEWDFEGTYDTTYLKNEAAIEWMNNKINIFTKAGKLDAIVESFIHYSGFVNTNWPDDGDYRYYLPLIEVGVERPDHLRNSYKPKNNKLFSYPYSALKIIGYGGESELKYELFPKDVHFGIISKFFAGASIQLYPVNYEGILDAYGEGVTGQPLPVFPYTQDQYMNEWNANINTRNDTVIAMNETKNLKQVATVFSGISGLANTALSSATMQKMSESGRMGAIGMGVGIGSKVVETGISMYANKLEYNQGLRAMAAQLKDTEARPSSIANQNASPSIPAVMKDAVVPFVQRVSIREVFAKKIDEFFSRYGYAVNRVGVPNIKSRPAFNFLRCNEAHVDGNIPNEDLLEIKAVLEHGVTFWHNHDVGNYNLENPAPITNNPRYCQPVG